MTRWQVLIDEFLNDLDERAANNQPTGQTWFNKRILEAEQEAVKLFDGEKVAETDVARVASFHGALREAVEQRWRSAETAREKADYKSTLVRLKERSKKRPRKKTKS